MTETIDTAQPEALRLADWLDANSSGVYRPAAEAAAELRRQHAAIAELEAENDLLRQHAAKQINDATLLTGINIGDGSTIICPHACELHFHHDGCPACAEHDAAASISTKGDGQ